jgi:hypothetical protein
MHRTVRALVSAAAAALSATTVLVGLTTSPAQAMNYDSAPLIAWAYTDRANPPHRTRIRPATTSSAVARTRRAASTPVVLTSPTT